jgi:hypothetical protein
MERCNKCILPANYLRITFDAKGICNYCNNYKEKQYLGDYAFKEKIENFLKDKPNRNKEYDCVIGFSGGRDSSYLLYWLTKVLKLKVLAYSTDNGFVPEQTINNMLNITNNLNTKLVLEKHTLLTKCYRHTIKAWMKRPTLQMVETFCTGCRVGVHRGLINIALKYRIPIIISGGTPFEDVAYRSNLMKLNPDGGRMSAIMGYFNQVIRNPTWIMNLNYVSTQILDYKYHYHYYDIAEKLGLLWVGPYWNYIRWEEDTIISTIKKELGWRQNTEVVSTWRGDCDIALLKLYIYKKVLGFNDKVVHLSNLIRDGQLDRNEALRRLEEEENIPDEVVKDNLVRFGINYSNFQRSLEECIRRPLPIKE